MNMSVPQPLLSVVSIPLTDIDVGDRLRGIDDDAAAVIAASMQEQGQRTPIEVRKAGKRYRLIAGAHRMRALALAGIETAFAVVVKANDLEAQLLEIDENICRRELSELDRATFLAKRKEVYEALHPEVGHGGDRKSDQNDKLVVLIQSFSQATAEKLGFSKRTIERSVARYKHIMPDVREKISGTWLAESGAQLDALSRETPEYQRQIADFIVQWPGVKNISEILRQIRNQPKKKPPTTYDKLVALWNRADDATKLRFHEFLQPEFNLEDAA
ncbi:MULTISPECIES: ParB/RepB/Spo0J family partition protein [Acetobacter]|uniref:ParB/RepB/Spo0J family partition protein n=1 Tax=Acetobacter TaxID=434 RepID=UPI00377069F6